MKVLKIIAKIVTVMFALLGVAYVGITAWAMHKAPKETIVGGKYVYDAVFGE